MRVKRAKGKSKLEDYDWMGEKNYIFESLEIWESEIKRRWPKYKLTQDGKAFRAYHGKVKVGSFGIYPGLGIIVGMTGKNMYGTGAREKRYEIPSTKCVPRLSDLLRDVGTLR